MEIKNLTGQINPYTNKRVDQPEGGPGKGSPAQKAAGGGDVTVNLSSAAKLMSTATHEAQNASDVRTEKVNKLKEQVRNGTYQPDIKKAAQNLVRDDLDLLV